MPVRRMPNWPPCGVASIAAAPTEPNRGANEQSAAWDWNRQSDPAAGRKSKTTVPDTFYRSRTAFSKVVSISAQILFDEFVVKVTGERANDREVTMRSF